ncbi:hypothetical protein [Streptomyces sp. NPDC012888]|uniref:hypothetical protein n=1 Tax=Streptomyces sp. NPDC012888 TaxID=3364855 RepID=UPI00368F8C55
MTAASRAWGPLSADVRRALELVLHEDTDAHRAYRAQLPYAEMAEGCTCPCRSKYLRVDRTAAPAAPPRGDSPVVASRLVVDEAGEVLGEALVFDWSRDGYVEELELALWEDAERLVGPLAERIADS